MAADAVGSAADTVQIVMLSDPGAPLGSGLSDITQVPYAGVRPNGVAFATTFAFTPSEGQVCEYVCLRERESERPRERERGSKRARERVRERESEREKERESEREREEREPLCLSVSLSVCACVLACLFTFCLAGPGGSTATTPCALPR